jgi:predicted DNA-binding transcriptional regulator AlpA
MDIHKVVANKKLLTAKQIVKEKLDCSMAYFYKKIADGEIPPPDVRQGRSVRWLESTIDTYIDSLVTKTKEGK